MSKPKIRKQFNDPMKGIIGEINDMPSMTVPDMNLSIQQLLQNHTRGVHSDVHDYGVDEGYLEQEIPQINDITELKERRANLYSEQRTIQQEIEEREQELKQNQIKAAREAEKKKMRQEILDEEKPPKTPPKKSDSDK